MSEAGATYVFDPGTAQPRSPALRVVPHTNIRRSGERRTIFSGKLGVAGIPVPAEAGVTFDLGATRSHEFEYDTTAGVDPELSASILTPFASDPRDDLLPFLARLVVADARAMSEADRTDSVVDEERLAEFVPDRVAELTASAARAPATITIEGESHFRMDEGEHRRMRVKFTVGEDGYGVFAIRLVDCDDATSVSISEPTLYRVSRKRFLTLYDASVDYGPRGYFGGSAPVVPRSPQLGPQIFLPPDAPAGSWSRTT